jgi:peptidoglycan hydrolase-like amidase
VRVGVFGLFHPTDITVSPGSASPLLIRANGSETILEGHRAVSIHLSAAEVRISSHDGGPVDVVLAIPGKIERRFHGIVLIGSTGPVIEMDRETAVASIVAAEIAPGAPLEALKAQAVVARAFLAASPPRHRGFDFCDTTHCQFLRAWPLPASDAYRAAQDTRGLLLTYSGVAFAPRYSAACGGRTLASDARERGSNGYRYQSVACNYCQRHAAEPVRGHRLGMCQQGASAMAVAGATFREILNHYYPGAAVSIY